MSWKRFKNVPFGNNKDALVPHLFVLKEYNIVYYSFLSVFYVSMLVIFYTSEEFFSKKQRYDHIYSVIILTISLFLIMYIVLELAL